MEKDIVTDSTIHILSRIAITSVACQRELWDMEIENNDGYLRPHIKGWLTKTNNSLTKITEVINIEGTDDNKTLIKLTTNEALRYYSNTMDNKHLLAAKLEEEYLPRGMVNTWITATTHIQYMIEKYKDRLDYYGLGEEIIKAYNAWVNYSSFFMKELFILEKDDLEKLIKEKDLKNYRITGIEMDSSDYDNIIQNTLGTDLTVDGKCPKGCCECCSLSVGFNMETYRKLKRVLKPKNLEKYNSKDENEWWKCPFSVDSLCTIYDLPFKPIICKVYSCKVSIFKDNMSKYKLNEKNAKSSKNMFDLLPKEIKEKIIKNPKVNHIMNSSKDLFGGYNE